MSPRSPTLVALLLALLCCGDAAGLDAGLRAKTAYSSDQSDLWWNPAESGWGMQIVQQADVLFATLFVYDAYGAPTFLTATLAPSGSLAWGGDLFRTAGPYFGAPSFDAATVIARKVGTLAFSRPYPDAGVLQYSVDGVAVTKILQRQLLRYDDYRGAYVATVDMTTANCAIVAENVQITAQFTINVAQNGTAMSLHWRAPDGTTCDFAGNYSQLGHLGQMEAGYNCSTGESGNMAFSELTNRVGMIAGRFQGHAVNNACDRKGSFTGLIPN